MRTRFSKFIKIIHLFGDLTLLNLSFVSAYIYWLNEGLFDDHYVSLLAVFNLAWFICIYTLKVYNIDRVTNMYKILNNLFISFILHGFIIFCFILAIKGYYYSRFHLLLTYIFFSIGLLLWRFILLKSLKIYRSKGLNYRNVIIIGGGSAGNRMYNYLKSDMSHGYRFIGFFDNEIEKCLYKEKVIGKVTDLPEFIKNNKIDEIFCALPFSSAKSIRDLMTIADNSLIRFKIVPDFRGFLNKKVNINFYEDVPILTLRKEPLEIITNKIVKRTFDIIFSLVALLIIFPPAFVILGIIIKATSPGPIFFVQKRNGRNNEEFKCFKFRTMRINDEADKKQAVLGDERITPIGNFLRKSNLDELPQFYNVLIGNMSIVGPRPHMIKHTLEYSALIDKFMVRQLVKPGITGWAQVNGYRGQTEDKKKMLKRVRHDLWYIENWNLLLDTLIIIRTVFNMVKGEKNAF